MLTEEQIKDLKPGDPLVIHGTFERMATDGDICVKFPMSLSGFVDTDHIKCAHPSAVSIDKHRYDPYRTFRNGDIVRYIERDGRSYVDAPPVGSTCRVCGCEDIIGMVSVEFKFSENEKPAVHEVPFYHLELITPVEEMGPYHIIHNSFCGYVIYKDNPQAGNIAVTFSRSHPDAKAAAEAECARLNKEWRRTYESK